MNRTIKQFNTDADELFKNKLLFWSTAFDEIVWLDSNDYEQTHSSYDAVLALDAFTSLKTDYYSAFDDLKEYQSTIKDWIFGYLTYDLKNDVENLTSKNFDGLQFPDLYFFQPKKIILLKKDQIEFHYIGMVDDEIDSDFEEISNTNVEVETDDNTENDIKIKLRIHKDAYFEKVNTMLNHIHRGDIYEANFCQEFYAENVELDTIRTFKNLNSISKPPFATFLKHDDKYLLSASPERFLRKEGNEIISQPIKGTAKRAATEAEDKKLITQLENDPKERSENVMIVDLVRNDLSRIALKGSVEVEELCKIYTFLQVHQMISTVRAEVVPEANPVDIIKAAFPMGSMTGAPKISAMKIIEKLEETKRGLYSGAVGYFDPEGNFDFNVIIRSILYNYNKRYVSFSVGSAITAKSVPENEYEECLVKAKAMREVLEK
ncbi:aminodeoxychorismate synthase component I [Galbibacter sp. EGI 63066]|uniref:aminodeoxychorismate synthase component I n=1 Tax=Galbibacter sp. EGI 63066 TaxID=2993559 RepID=UPI0022498E3D|nr:aminodeoxychorismate synthase component I [Galbibacter sp. EGI 63066]MCX2678730.1 aminodeoxychorismate synthase component I [Galbibacter sp. EGI 63066]